MAILMKSAVGALTIGIVSACSTTQDKVPSHTVPLGPIIGTAASQRSRTVVSDCILQQLAPFAGQRRIDTDTTPTQTTVDFGQRGFLSYHRLYRYTVVDVFAGKRSTTVLRMAPEAIDGPSATQAKDILAACTAP